MFKYVVNKKNFLDYKNVILTYWKMSIVLKGVTHDFSQKFENYSQSHFLRKRPRHDV